MNKELEGSFVNSNLSLSGKDGHGQANVGEHGVYLDVASADRVSGILRNTEAHVAIFSPAGTVGGTDDPEAIASLGLVGVRLNLAITNNRHKLVDLNFLIGSSCAFAVGLGEDTSFIEFQAAGSVYCNS